MNDLLNSLKADLLDRRLLPLLLLLGLALAGAVAYAELGGGGGSQAPAPHVAAISTPTPTGPTLSVSPAPADVHAAVAETTEGGHFQHGGAAHNPFVPLPSAPQKGQSAAASPSAGSSPSSPSSSSTGSGSGSGSGSGAGTGGSTTTTPTQPPKPTPKPKLVHKQVAVVGLLFGLAPTTPGQLSQLTPYADVKRLEPLPSANDPRIVFEGVSTSHKSAVFTLTREAILKGAASCLPSASQCEAIDLALGQSEELSYLEANGQTVTYELALLSIAWRETTYAKAARLNRGDRAGRVLLRRLNPPVLRHLRFSSAKGVLVYVHHHGV